MMDFCFSLWKYLNALVCGLDSIITLVLCGIELCAIVPNTLLGLKLGSLATMHR